ncbi:hypothetical protein J2045_000754 [Peteryoungia aggregata LMG 23059]|uniref:DUF4173 domain-containing protein n=1 Tax=Peteryoungia aggregata LMG 23059 TaxID=1368425 RepID=A0ABU0G337_9HYPH|nr:DUF4173 domain-containing protein [Peteryoungia aggregata]MDQ0419741.1 hypothetical protein [Peteryoungia aggregata LMG 23059]
MLTKFHSSSRRAQSSAVLLLGFLVFASDVLVFRQEPGLNLFAWCLLLCICILLVARPARFARSVKCAPFALCALLPLVEAPSWPATLVASLSLMILSLVASGLLPKTLPSIPPVLARLLLKVPLRMVGGVGQVVRSGAMPGAARGIGTELRFWILPLAIGAVFLTLFAGANPLIEKALASIDLAALWSLINVERLFFWAFMGGIAWVLLRPKLAGRCCRTRRGTEPSQSRTIIGEPVLLRALILFNLLFAVQTMLDMAYLWGGVALPDGMSYAEYAHRGAYPLVVTALLAALFVLLAIRPERSGSEASLIRKLVTLWIVQNILLCISAILRLDLYVEAYSLTGMRVAAGLWMCLVAIGLALILLRIWLHKNNAWLFAMNAASLAVLLLGVSLVDTEAFVAQYNVSQARELDGDGLPLDANYLEKLGPSALPAINRYLAQPQIRQLYPWKHVRMQEIRSHLLLQFQNRPRDWRSWTWRAQRLENYLATPVTVE